MHSVNSICGQWADLAMPFAAATAVYTARPLGWSAALRRRET